MQQMDAQREEGRILGFVKGLRLSSQLAYVVRDILSGEIAEVSWGHLIDESGALCSPECDIIVHRPGFVQRWNGGRDPIMDFRFIECSKALSVISCKSFVKSVDDKYCPALAKYGLQKIILFAECCEEKRLATLRRQAVAEGYGGLYCLYTLAEDGFSVKQDPDMYVEFAEEIKGLVAKSH